jgi:hypothetical protein
MIYVATRHRDLDGCEDISLELLANVIVMEKIVNRSTPYWQLVDNVVFVLHIIKWLLLLRLYLTEYVVQIMEPII